MKHRTNKPTNLKRTITKKQLLLILGFVLIILVGGAVWAIRTINNTQLNTSTVTPEILESVDTKIDEVVSADIADNSEPSNENTPNNSDTTQKPEPQPRTPTPDELCAKGTYTLDNSVLKCTYSIDVTKAPARLVVFAVETFPTYIQMYEEVAYDVSCSKPTACTSESWPSTPGRIQIAISEPTVVTASVKQTTPYGSPVKTYSFQQWELTQGGPNYSDGSYSYTLLGKFTADR